MAAEATKRQLLLFSEQEGRGSREAFLCCHFLCLSVLSIHSIQALSSLPLFKIHCPTGKKHSLKCPCSSSSASILSLSASSSVGHLLAMNWNRAGIRPDAWHPFLLEGRAEEARAMILTPRFQRPGLPHPLLPPAKYPR